MGTDSARENLGGLLRSLRRGHQTPQKDVAQALGVSAAHLSHIEHGRDMPSSEIVGYYDRTFGGDGIAWSAYLQAITAPPDTNPRRKGHEDYPIPGDVSEFVADVTIPDGYVLPPGHLFTKVWRIRNAGTVPWHDRWLARVGTVVGHGLPKSLPREPIPPTEPGQTADIAYRMRTSHIPGTCQIIFKMVDANGIEFFPDRYPQGLVCSITVK